MSDKSPVLLLTNSKKFVCHIIHLDEIFSCVLCEHSITIERARAHTLCISHIFILFGVVKCVCVWDKIAENGYGHEMRDALHNYLTCATASALRSIVFQMDGVYAALGHNMSFTHL